LSIYYLGIGKNLLVSICATKGQSIETTGQGLKTREEMLITLNNKKKATDTPPSSWLDPKRVQLCERAEVVGTWCRSQLPALKGVRGAC
jgi:hypothetical protein